MKKKGLVFLGFNNLKSHKRGVENVVHFQSLASPFDQNYYFHWDSKNHVYKYDKLICIGIKKNKFWFLVLNIILLKLKIRKKIFIHSHNPLMSIVSLFQSDLFTVHDGMYYLSNAMNHKFSRIFWFLEKILYMRCTYVHFISNYAKKMSLLNGRSKNWEIISNTSHFEMLKNEISFHNSHSKKFNNEVIKVFTVRSIEERALINLIIDVAEKLKGEKIEFFIAGKGPLLDFYRMKIESLGLDNISLLGYVSDKDLLYYYNTCNLVLVTAAYGEGFGLPIIEGYLFNKPVISSNVCAIPDVIVSKNFLFENNVDSIISKLDFVKTGINTDYKNYYDTYFSNEVIITKMNELYNKLF